MGQAEKLHGAFSTLYSLLSSLIPSELEASRLTISNVFVDYSPT